MMHTPADEPLLFCEAITRPTCKCKKNYLSFVVSGPWTMVMPLELESGPWTVVMPWEFVSFKGPIDFVEVYQSYLMTRAVYFCVTSN